jgi:hypothetical protein
MRQVKAQFSSKDLSQAIQEADVTVLRNRKAPRVVARVKSSKGFVSGTSGFANGYSKGYTL